MAQVILDRDEWMRRTGPFYPGLVALCSLTIVPWPRDLVATDEDRLRSAKWYPLVGASIGVLLAILAQLLLWLDMVPALAAILVILASIVMTGVGPTTSTAWTVQRLVSSPHEAGDSHRLYGPGMLALIGLLATRVIALMVTSTDQWGIAMVFSETIAYWAVVFSLYIGGDRAEQPSAIESVNLATPQPSLASLGVGSAVAGGFTVIALFLAGVLVLFAALCAALAAFALGALFQRRFGGLSNPTLAAIAYASGLLVLIAFATAHPATISPWILP